MRPLDIRKRLMSNTIKLVQLDPNGVCNAKCWFCPVRYEGNPAATRVNMSPELLERILADLAWERSRGELVDPSLQLVYTSHYNEALLYRHFERMLELLEKYAFTTMVLTNGVPLTPERIELIKAHPKAVWGVTMNIPAIDPEIWSARSGIPLRLHDTLIENLDYAAKHLPEILPGNRLAVQVNGVSNYALYGRGGTLELLENAPDFDLHPRSGEQATQVARFTARYPALNPFPMKQLIDRAGHLETNRVMTNRRAIDATASRQGQSVVGCKAMGGRLFSWLHVTPLADTFLCCQDYEMGSTFGNLATHRLEEIWGSDRHVSQIAEAFTGMCTACSYAEWGQPSPQRPALVP